MGAWKILLCVLLLYPSVKYQYTGGWLLVTKRFGFWKAFFLERHEKILVSD